MLSGLVLVGLVAALTILARFALNILTFFYETVQYGLELCRKIAGKKKS